MHSYVDNGATIDFGTWMQRWCPGTPSGENIAQGYSYSIVVNAWMNSPGHRANILNGGWTKIGVAYINAGGTAWATQDFSTTTCP